MQHEGAGALQMGPFSLKSEVLKHCDVSERALLPVAQWLHHMPKLEMPPGFSGTQCLCF